MRGRKGKGREGRGVDTTQLLVGVLVSLFCEGLHHIRYHLGEADHKRTLGSKTENRERTKNEEQRTKNEERRTKKERMNE